MTANLRPLLGVPAGLAVGLGLAWLPEPWDYVGVLLFCVVAIVVCLYFLWDMHRGQRQLQVQLRRMRYLLEQDREL